MVGWGRGTGVLWIPKRRRVQELWHYTALGQWKSDLLVPGASFGPPLCGVSLKTCLFFLDLVFSWTNSLLLRHLPAWCWPQGSGWSLTLQFWGTRHGLSPLPVLPRWPLPREASQTGFWEYIGSELAGKKLFATISQHRGRADKVLWHSGRCSKDVPETVQRAPGILSAGCSWEALWKTRRRTDKGQWCGSENMAHVERSFHAWQFTSGTAFLSKYRTHLKASHEKLQI